MLPLRTIPKGAVMLTRQADAQGVQALAHAPVVSVHGPDTLRAAATAMADNQIGLVVVRRGTLAVGVLSERDIVRAIAEGADVDDTRVDEWMTEDLAGVRTDATVREALEAMANNGVRHLLVRHEGRVEGVLSARDLLLALQART